MLRSGNPTLGASAFTQTRAQGTGKTMSIEGTVNKTFFLLLIAIFSASWVWGNPTNFLPFLMPATLIGFIVAITTVFKKDWAPITSGIYAFVEGIVIGGLSVMFESNYPGIVIQAVALTFGTLLAMLFLYKSRLIKVTRNFALGITAATGAICLVYFASMILSFFGRGIPLIHQSGPIGIGFSLFVVAIAAFNLVLAFDYIEKGAAYGAPKYMEWYGAFALIVTLVWLYIEILRLLSKTRRR